MYMYPFIVLIIIIVLFIHTCIHSHYSNRLQHIISILAVPCIISVNTRYNVLIDIIIQYM